MVLQVAGRIFSLAERQFDEQQQFAAAVGVPPQRGHRMAEGQIGVLL